MFGKKNRPRKSFDPAIEKPVLRCSICNGEQVAGFLNLQTGKLREDRFIRDEAELKIFLREYGLKEIEKVY